MFFTSLKQTCNEYLIKFSENQSAPKLRTGKHLHVLHVLRTYSTCSYPGYQDTTAYAALLELWSEAKGILFLKGTSITFTNYDEDDEYNCYGDDQLRGDDHSDGDDYSDCDDQLDVSCNYQQAVETLKRNT